MGAYRVEVLADAPDVYYRLDETGSGPFVDVANGHNLTPNATIVSAASLLVTDVDASATFDAAGAFFKATGSYTLSQQPLTVECWIKPTNITNTSYFVGCGNPGGWGVGHYATTGAIFFASHTTLLYNFTAALAAGVKRHLVFVMQTSNAVDLYIDGVFSQTIAGAGALGATTKFLQISGVQLTNFVTATVDEVAVYKSALSAGRIAAHYSAGNSPQAGVNFLRRRSMIVNA